MYCTNCGKDNAEGVSFCENCGTPLNTQPQGTVPPTYGQPQGTVPPVYGQPQGTVPPVYGQPQSYQPNMNGTVGMAQDFVKRKKNLKIFAGIGAVIVFVVVFLCIFTRSMNATINLLEKGINNQNGGNILDAMYPPKMQKKLAELEGVSVDELENEFERDFSGRYDAEVSIKLTDRGDKKDRDFIESTNKRWKELYGVEMRQARDVELEIKCDGDTKKIYTTMYQVDGKWYVMM